VHKAIQSEAINLTEESKAALMKSAEMAEFVRTAGGLCEQALQQNETVDIFGNEFSNFEAEEMATANGSKHENNLKGLLSFTHLVYSKGRNIPCVDWHPTKSGETLVCAHFVSVGRDMVFCRI